MTKCSDIPLTLVELLPQARRLLSLVGAIHIIHYTRRISRLHFQYGDARDWSSARSLIFANDSEHLHMRDYVFIVRAWPFSPDEISWLSRHRQIGLVYVGFNRGPSCFGFLRVTLNIDYREYWRMTGWRYFPPGRQARCTLRSFVLVAVKSFYSKLIQYWTMIHWCCRRFILTYGLSSYRGLFTGSLEIADSVLSVIISLYYGRCSGIEVDGLSRRRSLCATLPAPWSHFRFAYHFARPHHDSPIACSRRRAASSLGLSAYTGVRHGVVGPAAHS